MAMQRVKFDFGEKRHVRTNVMLESGEEYPFKIRNAKWELTDADGIIEDSGECVVDEHELDAYINPLKAETYTLKYTYEVADEIWVDKIKVVVS